MINMEMKRELRKNGVNTVEEKVQEGGMMIEKILGKMAENMEELSMLMQGEKGMWRFTPEEGRKTKG